MFFEKSCKEDGSLELKYSKWKFLYLCRENLHQNTIDICNSIILKIFRKAAKVLGAAIGSSSVDVVTLTAKIIRKYDILFTRLQHKGLSNVAADHILRKCGIPSLNYLSRVIPQ